MRHICLHRFRSFLIVLPVILVLGTISTRQAGASEKAKWSGVDEAVIETIAKEHGRQAKPALIDKDQGDILLFMFLIAGAVGGFAAGYWWRKLIAEKKENPAHRKLEETTDRT